MMHEFFALVTLAARQSVHATPFRCPPVWPRSRPPLLATFGEIAGANDEKPASPRSPSCQTRARFDLALAGPVRPKVTRTTARLNRVGRDADTQPLNGRIPDRVPSTPSAGHKHGPDLTLLLRTLLPCANNPKKSGRDLHRVCASWRVDGRWPENVSVIQAGRNVTAPFPAAQLRSLRVRATARKNPG